MLIAKTFHEMSVTAGEGTTTIKPLRVINSKYLCTVDREPPLGETHPVNCCRSHHSEHFRIQEPEGMPSCCPDSCYKGFMQPVLRVLIRFCGLGLPPATSEMYIGDGAVMISRLHSSRLQHHLKHLCHGGSRQVQLKHWHSRRMSDKVCMMYKSMNRLVECNPCCRFTRA